MSPRRKTALSTEYVLLALLAQEPSHGYELHRRLGELPGIAQVWNLKQALLYAKLEMLEEAGYIQVQALKKEFIPPRKVFKLTEMGESSLDAWLREPVYRARMIQQVFSAKLLCALQASPQTALDLIEKQRQIVARWHSRLLEDDPGPDQKTVFGDWAVYRFKHLRDQSTLAWLDEIEAEIRKQL